MCVKTKYYISFLEIILVVSVLIFPCFLQVTNANPLAFVDWEYGIYLPLNSSEGIEMLDSLVKFSVFTERNHNVYVNFEGDYSYFNTNDTKILLIGAPFRINFNTLSPRMKVYVNGLEINFEIIKLSGSELEPFKTYFDAISTTHFILCNVTFSSNQITTLKYVFSVTIQANFHWNGVNYFVGTANSWKDQDVFNESVEFYVTGIQPHEYTDGCIISKIVGGKSYIWSWENEPISVSKVGISYYFDRFNSGRLAWMILVPTISLISLILLPLLIVKLIKKRKMIA